MVLAGRRTDSRAAGRPGGDSPFPDWAREGLLQMEGVCSFYHATCVPGASGGGASNGKVAEA